MINEKWDRRFFDLCKAISTWSKDKSTKLGVVIVDDNKNVLSIGYNGFPRGVDDNVECRYERPLKYSFTEHAERNAIYNAARKGVSVDGCTMYMVWFPCCDCGRAIIQSGIKRIVCSKVDLDNERWTESFKISQQMLQEAGVIIDYID